MRYFGDYGVLGKCKCDVMVKGIFGRMGQGLRVARLKVGLVKSGPTPSILINIDSLLDWNQRKFSSLPINPFNAI